LEDGRIADSLLLMYMGATFALWVT